MPCPFYNDFTRECVEKFKAISNFITFDICSDDQEYNNCIVYKAINENKVICSKMDKCTEDFSKLSVKIILKLIKTENILKVLDLDEYCFSKNYLNCLRYKYILEGKEVPSSLRPDGSKMELKDIIFKKFG